MPCKENLFDELDRLSGLVTGEERKSSGSSHDIAYSNELFEQESVACHLELLNYPAEESPAEYPSPIIIIGAVDDKVAKNETKNIPKNYGKAILGYIQKSRHRAIHLLQQLKLDCDRFFEFMQQHSRSINSIADLRWLWNGNEFSEPIRILSYEFMRKHSLPYIFKSRIKNHLTHIKYREKFIDGLRRPGHFRNIKDY